jgi:type IV pilus assembly protein PilA
VHGFSLLELMIVIAVIAILALIALPGVPDKFVRDQIVDAVRLADIAKLPVAAAWAASAPLPLDNAAAGLPEADKIVNNYISSVAIESGAIQITFGNHANGNIVGKILTFRPGVVDGSPVVPVAWVCGNAEPPKNMTAKGLNKTDVALKYLPLNCRSNGPPASLSG